MISWHYLLRWTGIRFSCYSLFKSYSENITVWLSVWSADVYGSYIWYRGMFEFQLALCVQGVLVPERLERCGPCCPVETEANRDSKSTYERGPSLVGPLGSSCRHNSSSSYLGSPVQNIFSSPQLFHFICLHRPASWVGSRAASPVSCKQ